MVVHFINTVLLNRNGEILYIYNGGGYLMQKSIKDQFILLILLFIFIVIFIWSLINPKDLFTWFLEVVPVIIGLIVILATYNRFRLTNLVYVLILVHAIILVIGGHYTYAEMPVFNWLRDIFDLSRNYYDRLGHFVQGFVFCFIRWNLFIVMDFKPS